MDAVRWVKPVYADQPMTAHVTVMEARRSRSKPDRGILRLGFDVRDDADETLLTFETMTMVRARPA